MTSRHDTSTFIPRHVGITSKQDLSRAFSVFASDNTTPLADPASTPTTPVSTAPITSLETLVDAALPTSIREGAPTGATDPTSVTDIATPLTAEDLLPGLPASADEAEVLAELRALADRNVPMRQMIGQGFSDTITPAVLRRNILENPAWYTAYTPYQPEISQGRLEALMVFQTVIADLTGLPIANASLLDESSAAAEAMLLMRRANRAATQTGSAAPVLVDTDVFPQTLAVLRGRARAADIDLVEADLSQGLPTDLPDGPITGIIVQQAGDSGAVRDWTPTIAAAKARDGLVTVIADLLSLTLLTPPGEVGADISVGSSQRFGVPLFFGGPHAAFMAVTESLTRQLPGRLVGISHDDAGAPAYRLALQTREQHIRRERATSNICTAQALLAIIAGMYAVHHGPDGLRAIAERTHAHAARLADTLADAGIAPVADHFFDTVRVILADEAAANEAVTAAERSGINIRRVDARTVSASTDETTTGADINAVLAAFGIIGASAEDDASADTASAISTVDEAIPAPDHVATDHLPASLRRTSGYLTHPVFHGHRSETSLMRYLRRLSDRDLALDRTMIPLGSCTMKLNAAVEMEAISWPGFAGIHPFAPASQTQGWRALIADLEHWLAEISGYDAVTLQPNGGSQGEYTGLQAIRLHHLAAGHPERRICLIPASAHGTNAASAALAGLEVVNVATAEDGTIDLSDLHAKLDEHRDAIAAIMITYPSTHGVFEAQVGEVCALVHDAGGQVYIDGANLNALVGLARPGRFGGDVSHLNLHKTFCIPHGGGGPGVGPVAVAAHLTRFLPGAQSVDALHTEDAAEDQDGVARTGSPVAATTFGSAGVLPISWAYIRLMGASGLRRATQGAVLNANHLARRLSADFPILYTGPGGLVAHECLLDLRELTHESGVTAEDVAKRLIDFGFHAPTLAFPVPGTLMVEPTESEDLAELDRFVTAMHTIRGEIQEVIDGTVAAEDSLLHHAPHTATALVSSQWDRAYTREQAAYPVADLRVDKYFPPVGRIDGAWGDRHLIATLPEEDQDR